MTRLGATFVVLLLACSQPTTVDDAGAPFDAGVPTACDSPEDCHVAGLSQVCRRGACTAVAPCSDDLECGLGERCTSGQCRFTGCVTNDDCGTGTCITEAFSCVECAVDDDCPRSAPVCSPGRTCQRCVDDRQCPAPGPAHCSAEGSCVHCTSDDHCPNGLACGPGNTCVGAQAMQACPPEVTCGPGLACIQLNGNSICLKSCNLYTASSCPAGDICYRLTYSGGTSLVFEGEGPIGVCYQPQSGLRGPRASCNRTVNGSNCQPNLWCVPDTASVSLCRSFCNPKTSGGCATGEVCTGFYGDSSGREYGLCLPDNGFGKRCTVDGACRNGLSCQPYDDPSASTNLSNVCQFNQGGAEGLSPCRNPTLPDGGPLPPDRACRSGMCRADPLVRGATAAPYFCYAACATDADCNIGTRTGVCEGSFSFTSPYGTSGSVTGCRPRCGDATSCAEYGTDVICRARLTGGSSSSFTSTCSPASGTRPAGAPCTNDTECRANLCLRADARGVYHSGFCAEPCVNGCDLGDGGAPMLPLQCQPTTLLGFAGFDGNPTSGDEVRFAPKLCSGAACASNADCQPDGGSAVCTLELSAAGSSAAQRCRLPAGSKAGGATCSSDSECLSGVCGVLHPDAGTTTSVCFEACTGGSTCPGGTSCQAGVLGVRLTNLATVMVDSCAP